ncbi:MAG TPA: hypothetical protein VFH15_08350 [Pyrinomonadaceae bacterium]|nr:hypothetical protein [Pyrinomonadaceae bacterium]
MKLLKNICCCLCLTIVSLTSCSSNTLNMVNRADTESVGNVSISDDEKLFYLDLNTPEIVQPLEASDWVVEKPKFVKVEVVEVVNPKRHPISFQVYYRSATADVYLGSFGLFPADNPGKFIVATQNKVKNDGAIVLALVRPANVGADDTVKVGVRRIKLVNDR